jgi:hypothetical protein
MIITQLKGGLGNQMFQYAAGLALARERRTVLKLDVSWYRDDPAFEAHNRYGLDCFNISEQFATEDEIARVRGFSLTRTERWSVALARAFRFYRYAEQMTPKGHWHRQTDFKPYAEFSALPDHTYLDGMWQSEGFFDRIAEVIRLHFSFRYPASAAVNQIAGQIRSVPSVAIHFRRGDYVRNAHFNREMGVLNLAYYQRAAAHMRERFPTATFFIFSDDIEAVEKDFRPPGAHTFVRATPTWNSFDHLRLMSFCQHAIIANSTFSWWAAWLNAYPAKTIIAPDPWFSKSEHDGSAVVPASWNRFSVSI